MEERERSHPEPGDTPTSRWVKRFEAPCSAVLYATCSILMVILNKLVITTYDFNYPFVLIFVQNASALVFIAGLKAFGWITYPEAEWQRAKRWMPLVILFVIMLVTSLLALQSLSVQVATMIKHTAIVTTAVGDAVLFKHTFNKMTLASFLLIMSGSVLGVTNDAWVTALGVFWAVVNVLSTSAFQLYMKGLLNDLKSQMGKWGPVYYNNLLSLPPLAVMAFYDYREWSTKVHQEVTTRPAVIAYMLVLMVVSAIMTMSSFWCIAVTSPTTYGVIGGFTKAPLTIIGIYVFDQFPTPAGWVGIVGALLGGLLYSHAMKTDTDTRKRTTASRGREREADIENPTGLSDTEGKHRRPSVYYENLGVKANTFPNDSGDSFRSRVH